MKHTFVISQCAGTIALFMSTTATVMFCIMVNELNTNDEVKHWATVMGNSAKFMPVGFFMIGAFFTLFGILVWVFMQCGDVMTGWCIVACGPLLFVLPSLAVRKGAWALLMVHETANAIHKARKPSVVGAGEIHATLAKYVLEEKASSVLEIEKDEFKELDTQVWTAERAVSLMIKAGLSSRQMDEIRERMSGNLCRCGAYANIVAAIRDAATETSA